MKKALLVLCILYLMTSIVSCDFRPNYYNGTNAGAYYELLEYNLPGMGNRATICVLEEDAYGRIMFSCLANNAPDFHSDFSYGICQKKTDTQIYYYEDICILYGESEEAITQDQINAWKKKNDWNTELQIEKCVERELVGIKAYDRRSVNPEPSLSSIEELCAAYLESDSDTVSHLVYYGATDRFGRQVIYLKETKYKSKKSLDQVEYTKTWILMMGENISVDQWIMEIDDWVCENYQVCITTIKEANNWNK